MKPWLFALVVMLGTGAVLGGLYVFSMQDAGEVPFFYHTR
jgi:hypothetical protein